MVKNKSRLPRPHRENKILRENRIQAVYNNRENREAMNFLRGIAHDKK